MMIFEKGLFKQKVEECEYYKKKLSELKKKYIKLDNALDELAVLHQGNDILDILCKIQTENNGYW